MDLFPSTGQVPRQTAEGRRRFLLRDRLLPRMSRQRGFAERRVLLEPSIHLLLRYAVRDRRKSGAPAAAREELDVVALEVGFVQINPENSSAVAACELRSKTPRAAGVWTGPLHAAKESCVSLPS